MPELRTTDARNAVQVCETTIAAPDRGSQNSLNAVVREFLFIHAFMGGYELPDQSGRVAIVTGRNSGIGFEAANALACNGARVIIAARRDSACEKYVLFTPHMHVHA